MLKDEDILKIVNKHVDRVEELPKLVKKLSGLTNLMYRVDIDSRPSVILRKFNGDMNRKAEN